MEEIQHVATEQAEQLTSHLKAAYDLRISDLKQSIKITKALLDQFNLEGHLQLAAKAKNNLGLFFLIQGEFETAQNYSLEALDYYESVHDELGIADAKYNIGSIYYRTNKYHQALLLLADSLKTYREHNDYYNQARTLKSMGTVYEYFSDQDKAIEVYEKSIEASKAINELGLESNALNPLSSIYYKQGKVDLAMETIERSISLKNATKDTRGLAFALYGRGKILIKLGLYNKAINDFKETISICEEVGDKLGLCMTYNKMGVAYMEAGERVEAKNYFEKAIEVSEKYHIEFILFKVYYHLYLLAKIENEPKKALDYLERHLNHKKSVINKENYTLIKSYEAVSRIESLERESKIQFEKNQIIENKNAELDSFFYRISHDLKGPISSLMGLHNVVLLDVKDPVALKYFEMCKNQVNRMNNIVINLIELTQLNHAEKQKIKIDFLKLIDECINSCSYFENFKLIKFIKEIEEFEFQSEWVIVNTILQNLIENAIKYSAHFEPFVKITVSKKNETIEIAVADNGPGIDETHQTKIFNMFFRANERIKGSGLGLYILKRAVERLNGAIELSSKLNEGSTFRVILPC